MATITTWFCTGCGYKQDFDPADAAKMASIFPGVAVGHCPACFLGQNSTKDKCLVEMNEVVDEAEKSQVTE